MDAASERYVRPDEVERKLKQDFGLSSAPFRRALGRARLEWATCTVFDAPSYPGTVFWGVVVRALREELINLGWSMADPRNLSLTISPDGSKAIVVETGDEHTGIEHPLASPCTKSAKGPSVFAAVEANLTQMSLFDTQKRKKGRVVSGAMTYVFLVRIEKDGSVFGEVSLPLGASADGRINRWRERIVIPVIGDDGDAPLPKASHLAPGPDIDVAVTRRVG